MPCSGELLITAYYNEHDPAAAAWLRELIAGGHIAPGHVDERSIEDVRPSDLDGFTQCHFFAGIGGWSLALRLAGWSDRREIWTGSCPCQSFSAAGKGAGFADERHLWPAWFHLISARRPRVIFGEQVEAAVRHGWLDLVRADLEGSGYAVGAAVLGAHSVGSPHVRQRLWFVADSDGSRRGTGRPGEAGDGRDATWVESTGLCATGGLVNTGSEQMGVSGFAREHGGAGTVGLGEPDCSGPLTGNFATETARHRHSFDAASVWAGVDWVDCIDGKARPIKPGIFPLVNGLPRGVVRGSDSFDANATSEARKTRIKGYGNAIVPQVAAQFISAYIGE